MKEKYLWRTIGASILATAVITNMSYYKVRQAKTMFYATVEKERIEDTKHTCNELLLRYNLMSTEERTYVDHTATNLRTLKLQRLEEALDDLKRDFPDHLPAERKGQDGKW